MMITKIQLATFTGNAIAEKYYDALVNEMQKANIVTKQCVVTFLAQILHESMFFISVRENLNYTAEGIKTTWPGLFHTIEDAQALAHQPYNLAAFVYGGPHNDLGNRSGLDGWKYRGGGPIGITGLSNYTQLAKDTGVDFVNHPEL